MSWLHGAWLPSSCGLGFMAFACIGWLVPLGACRANLRPGQGRQVRRQRPRRTLERAAGIASYSCVRFGETCFVMWSVSYACASSACVCIIRSVWLYFVLKLLLCACADAQRLVHPAGFVVYLSFLF